MKKIGVALFLVVVWGQVGWAQRSGTRILLSYNMRAKDQIWDVLGKGISNFQVDLFYAYNEINVVTSASDTVAHHFLSFNDTYLFPLYSHHKKSGNTTPDETYIILNLQNEPLKIYRQLKESLAPIREILTYNQNGWHDGRVRLLVHNNGIYDELVKDGFGVVGLLGDKNDLETTLDNHQMPLIEVDFQDLTSWSGYGNIWFEDFVKIKTYINNIHLKGRKISILNCPNHKSAWDILVTAKADFINTNNPESVLNYLNERK